MQQEHYLSEIEFDRLLLEAVDEALSSIGESSKQAIYFHLEKGFSIKKLEIPRKISEFAAAIEKIFGLGANFLEILIMKSLYRKVNKKVQLARPEDFQFPTYIATLRESFLEEGKNAWETAKELTM
jgi:hypothetical protein